VYLFERDCSLQRRHQKVIEEAPAPGLDAVMRDAMGAAAVRAAEAVGYRGAGTVEFITDSSESLRADRFFFMEMNTRLQVEHPVTEMITRLDLVEWQLRVGAGEPLPLSQRELAIDGHAVEARLYAEDPARNFLPQTGRLTELSFAGGPGVRVDAGVRQGGAITAFYDPMVAKVIAHGPTRAAALERLTRALQGSHVAGCATNLVFLTRLLRHPDFVQGAFDTGLIDRDLAGLVAEPPAPPEVVAAAALAAGGFLHKPQGDDPFSSLAHFRLWGEASRTLTLRQADALHSVTVFVLAPNRFRVSHAGGDVEVDVLQGAADRIRIAAAGRVQRLDLRQSGPSVTIRSEVGEYHFIRAEGAAAEGEAAGAGVARAAMPGLVVAVHVEPGQMVAKGEALVVTEAMKMEHTLFAERNGRVASVEVGVGDQVQEGAVLVTLDDAHA
jgi:3-methylcrotonyl-CoA carboxylase alpha subunit